jgi:hypothetical protein
VPDFKNLRLGLTHDPGSPWRSTAVFLCDAAPVSWPIGGIPERERQTRSKTRTTTTETQTAKQKQVPDFYIFENAGGRQAGGM